ncbi:hypothetical protein FIU89_19240 [Roseovarius sp. THAF27]|uniref:DUF6892 domain-containing protein n=1 Tax=unclassified Roseovarius TaxID=2614913 RepID=UPI0012697069|nr:MULTISPECIES: hypothetical protein [unclassified Roseovarius]QFT82765.1 hypothetical protein FIU89_19240 [Roseovarius sp. THAF27]QFT98204.1 hypothetical protein FIU85_12875 [Roseovarius sp. THAF8]
MRDWVPVADLQKDHAPFADPNFKLAVIDALMSNGTLDLGDEWTFQDRLSKGQYDYERDGYTLNRAFLSYFRQYPLTAAHLAAVEELWFDGGLDIYGWIFTFWGGETEDFDIDSLADLALLPNLRVFGFSAMHDANDLAAYLRAPKLEVLDLGLIGRPWRNWDALLQLPKLRKFRYFTTDHAPEADEVLATLRARGVTINEY